MKHRRCETCLQPVASLDDANASRIGIIDHTRGHARARNTLPLYLSRIALVAVVFIFQAFLMGQTASSNPEADRLIRLLEETNGAGYDASIDLSKMGQSVVPLLLKSVASTNGAKRFYGLCSLELIKPHSPETIDAIAKLIGDPIDQTATKAATFPSRNEGEASNFYSAVNRHLLNSKVDARYIHNALEVFRDAGPEARPYTGTISKYIPSKNDDESRISMIAFAHAIALTNYGISGSMLVNGKPYSATRITSDATDFSLTKSELQSIPSIFTNLASPNPRVRLSAAAAIETLGPGIPSFYDQLISVWIESAKSKDFELLLARGRSVRTLDNKDGAATRRVIELLRKGLRDSTLEASAVEMLCESRMSKFSSQIRKALERASRSPSKNVKMTCINSVARSIIPIDEQIALMKSMQVDADPEIASRASEVLSGIYRQKAK